MKMLTRSEFGPMFDLAWAPPVATPVFYVSVKLKGDEVSKAFDIVADTESTVGSISSKWALFILGLNLGFRRLPMASTFLA